MKLSKKKSTNKGYFITCHIDKNTYTSWWTSPPESVDHVGIEYLKDRYCCITTKKRVEKFKGLYKKLMKSEGE